MAKNEVSQAAEKVAAAESKKVKKEKNPNGNWFVRAGKAIKKFFKDIKGECKKIVWPDGKTVVKSTAVVLVVVAICAVIIFAIDQLLALGISGLKSLATSLTGTDDAVEATTTAGMMLINRLFLG